MLLLYTNQTVAQSINSDIKLAFVKDTDIIKTGEVHFNTLKICNNSAKPIIGDVVFSGPENWKIISFASNKTTINPGDTAWIPVRVSPSLDAIGGISYLLNASFRTPTRLFSVNAYLTIPLISNWDLSTMSSSVYLTETMPVATFQIKLHNRGNVNEVIKLDCKLGKTLMFRDIQSSETAADFIYLPAFKDTTITHTVTFQEKLSLAEKVRYEQNWKESSVKIVASNEKKTMGSEIQIRKLSSVFTNQRAQTSTPLNFDFNIYNLMSNQMPRSNLNVYGSLLLPGTSEIQYSGGFQNLYLGENQNFDFNRQVMYNIRYTDKKNNIQLGYNTYSGMLHSVNGRGIVGSYLINNSNRVNYALIQNPFTDNVGGNVGYATTFKKISLKSELTYESNIKSGYSAASVLLGGGFTFLKSHRVNFAVLGSNAHYTLSGRDTAVLGMSYKLNYNVNVKNFDLRFSGTSSMNNHITNSGMQQYYLDSRYILTDNIRFALYGNRMYYSTTRYPYNFNNAPNFNSSDYLRLTTIFSSPKVIYQVGPNYIGSMRQSVNSLTGYVTQYNTFQPGIWGSATFHFAGYSSISPNVTISNMSMKYQSSDPTVESFKMNNGLAYTIGVNYYNTNFRMNAYYSSGSAGDMLRSFEIYEQPSVSRSLQVRPAYENYFFNRKIKLSAFVNYAYYLPSERQNVTYNVKYDHYLKKGWNLYISGFVFANSRKDEDGNRLSTMDLNFIAGFSKSFNLQQPRVKYYDLKTVFFNDLNGDRMKSDNEPPVSNILVNVNKDKARSQSNTSIPELDMISDINGEILIENLPRDNYQMSYQPLINLQSYYFLNGSEQSYFNDKKRVMYVPLVESYKVKGKVIVIRDPNSTEGKLNLDGIRITATGENGEAYSVLTDKFGAFILNVPNADKYNLKVNNVFGEHFNIEANEILVQFTKNKTINVDFTFIEKRREINFNNGNQIFKFKTE